ncbi:MAG: DoxX family protein [Casimicrobium sp.]
MDVQRIRASYPFVSLSTALTVLRIAVAVFFMAHAIVRIMNGTIPRFGAFLETQGWPMGVALVWMISIYEIVAGSCLIFNRGVRWWASGLAFIAAMGIVIIHAKLGWFVGEHGTGGVEYSLSLLVSLLVLIAHDSERGKDDLHMKRR